MMDEPGARDRRRSGPPVARGTGRTTGFPAAARWCRAEGPTPGRLLLVLVLTLVSATGDGGDNSGVVVGAGRATSTTGRGDEGNTLALTLPGGFGAEGPSSDAAQDDAPPPTDDANAE